MPFCFHHLSPTQAYGSGDKSDYFLNPVSKADVPDYYDVIKRPMCWSLIDKKLTEHQYLDLHEFKVSNSF